MNKIKLTCLSLLLISGSVSANPVCNGFQIKLKNNLADDLVISKIKLNGAQIQPGFFEHLKSHTEQVFTINDSVENVPMNGEFTLRTMSIPSKTVKVKYSLENTVAACLHDDLSPASNYSLEKTRKPGEVQYSINNQ